MTITRDFTRRKADRALRLRAFVHTILTVGGSLILGFAAGYYYAAADLSAVVLGGLK